MGYFAENFDYVLEGIEAINEAYFGKTKDVLAIEKAFHDLRAPYIEKSSQSQFLNLDTYTPKLANDPNKRKLEKTIMKAFGFSDACIQIENSGMNNAETMSSSMSIDLGSQKLYKSAKKASSKKNGFKFDKNDDIVFLEIMYSGVILNPNITDAELTAITLHEIGHNFSPAAERGCKVVYRFPALAMILRIVSDICGQIAAYSFAGFRVVVDPVSIACQTIMSILEASNAGKKVVINIKGLEKNIIADLSKVSPGFIKFIGNLMTGKAIAGEVMNSVSYLMKYSNIPTLASLPINVIKWIGGALGNPSGYSDEKFADAFPRMYGYGAELISALQKLSNSSNYAAEEIVDKNLPILPAIYNLYMLPFNICAHTFDEHPDDFDRYNFIISDIQKELDKTDLDPKKKKQIMQDAKDMKDEYEKYQDNMVKLNKNGAYGLYSKVVLKLFGGTLKSKVKGTHVNKDIDKFIDELD